MDQLPVEIWSQIVGSIWEERYTGQMSQGTSNQSLCNIILTSRGMHVIGSPLLYRHMSLDTSGASWKKAVRFLNTLLSNEFAALAVHHLTFTIRLFRLRRLASDGTLEPAVDVQSICQLFSKALEKTSNLSTLRLKVHPRNVILLPSGRYGGDYTGPIETLFSSPQRFPFNLACFGTNLPYSVLLSNFIHQQTSIRAIHWIHPQILDFHPKPTLPSSIVSVAFSLVEHIVSYHEALPLLIAAVPSVRHLTVDFDRSTGFFPDQDQMSFAWHEIRDVLGQLETLTFFESRLERTWPALDTMLPLLTNLRYLKLCNISERMNTEPLEHLTQAVCRLPSLKVVLYGVCDPPTLAEWLSSSPKLPPDLRFYINFYPWDAFGSSTGSAILVHTSDADLSLQRSNIPLTDLPIADGSSTCHQLYPCNPDRAFNVGWEIIQSM